MKTKSRGQHYIHLKRAIANSKWSFVAIVILTIIGAVLVVWNVKAIQYITALLVSKSLVTNELVESAGSNLPGFNLTNFIHDFYSYVSVDGKDVYIDLWGMGYKFTAFTFSYTMIGAILIMSITVYIRFLISGHMALSYDNKLRKELIAKIIDQDVQYFDSNQIGSIVSTVVKDTAILNIYIKEAPINYLSVFTNTLLSAIIMFTISWELALCVFGLLLGVIVVIFLSALISSKVTKNISLMADNQNNKISEKIYSIKLVKSFGTFDREKREFNSSLEHTAKREKKKFWISEIIPAFIIGGIGSFSMASVIFGVFLFKDESQTLISIIASFTTGVIVMVLPIMQLRQLIAELPKVQMSSENINKTLNAEIEIDKFKKLEIKEKVKSISFKNVSFTYPTSSKPVLSNFSVDLVKGKKYAFVGPTGSGKSTIAKLLLRFYNFQEGEILINNKINLKELNLSSWLNKVGYVDQEPQILSGTIYDNVAYGMDNKTHKEIIEACKKAKLHDLIMAWPNQYETVLAERGAQLSGGQKQRLVIARLILKDPEILILDEATSALDNIVEAEIQKELEILMVGRTTISIAHRLSTIKNFDEIFVLQPEHGIVQTGNFDELTKIEGLFRNLYMLSK